MATCEIIGFRFEYYYKGIITVDTRDCNYHCLFCFLEKSEDYPIFSSVEDFFTYAPPIENENWKSNTGLFVISAESLVRVVKDLMKKQNIKKMRFSSGEISLHFKFLLEFIEKFAEQKDDDYKIYIETNGYLFAKHPDWLDALVPYKDILHFRVSLKTPSLEKFQALHCSNQRVFEKIRELPDLLEERKLGYHVVYILDYIDQEDLITIREIFAEKPNVLEHLELEKIFYYPEIIKRFQDEFRRNPESPIKKFVKGRFYD